MEYRNDGMVKKKLGSRIQVRKDECQIVVKRDRVKGKVDSWGYQIVVQVPDFVINGSLVIRDA